MPVLCTEYTKEKYLDIIIECFASSGPLVSLVAHIARLVCLGPCHRKRFESGRARAGM